MLGHIKEIIKERTKRIFHNILVLTFSLLLQILCIRLAAAIDKAYQLLAHGRWFSQGTPASSTAKTGRHDIAEILLKVALSTKNQINQSFFYSMIINVMICIYFVLI
jgi:hypothetical protein